MASARENDDDGETAHLMGDEQDQTSLDDDYNLRKKSYRHPHRKILLILIYGGIGFFAVLLIAAIFASLHSLSSSPSQNWSCLDVRLGYTCHPDLSQHWGQYSPYYLVPSSINRTTPPPQCRLTSAHLLSRHGARDPTHDKSQSYTRLIAKVQSSVPKALLKGPYAFLTTYNYTLGSDQLTALGRQQMSDSGHDFFARYADLARRSDHNGDNDKETPFIRASDQRRVVESAEKFAQGFHNALINSPKISRKSIKTRKYPYPILTIPETKGQNSTLSHNHQCRAFERVNQGTIAQRTFATTWLPGVQARLLADLPGSALTLPETIYMMDLCPFTTVASQPHASSISPFCNLFTPTEWNQYSYHQTLGKYYGHGSGAPLGPTQGVGWVNELIARLTRSVVHDSTTTNRTLDGANSEAFPLDRKLYADFSHDNEMMSIFAAMGLYNTTTTTTTTMRKTAPPELDTGRVMDEKEMAGYGAAKMVPFAGRMVVEGMDCADVGGGPMVRVVMNGRVLPLEMCGGDEMGRCSLDAFVDALAFARNGGRWDECFQDGSKEED